MPTLLTDLRWAARTLLKSPGFTVVAVLAIALGIGANTAIFSVVNSVLLQPLPFPHSDRLVVLDEGPARGGRFSISYPGFLDWREQARSFDKMAGYRQTPLMLTGVDPPDRLRARMVSAEFFEILGVQPLLGHLFTAEEDRDGAQPVAVLNFDSWKTRFGGDPQIIGKKLILNDTPTTVTGVLRPGFRFGAAKDELFIPLSLMPTQLGARKSALDRGNHQGLRALARMKAGVTLPQAVAEMKGIAARLEQQYPKSNSGLTAIGTSLYELWVGDVRTTLVVLLAAVGFVLLIACANVANLLLARATARTREIAIRVALGASRWQIVRQLLTESVMLSLAAGVIGLLFGYWSIHALLKFVPDNIPRLAGAAIDPWVLLFTIAVSLITGVLFGLVPAIQASRFSVNESLKSESRGSTAGRSSRRARRLLLVGEIAMALVLSIGAGLMIRSLVYLQHVDPGFQPDKLLTMSVTLSSSYSSHPQKVSFYETALDRIRAVPGVQSASIAGCLPIDGTCWGSIFMIAGRPLPAKRSDLLTSQWNVVGSDYFETMGIRLLRGRTINRYDTPASSSVAVINESAAKKFFPNEDPIGQKIKQGWPESPNPWREIVGVVADVKQNGVDAEQLPEIFLPHAHEAWGSMNVVIRGATPPASLIAPVRGVIRDLNKDIPVYSIRPMDQLMVDSLAQRQFSMLLLALFATLALLLAAIGIYGVIAYSVSQRTQEIGIRMALGARQAHVLGMVVGEGMMTAGAGIALGLAAAFAATRLMRTMLYGVESSDAVTYAGVAALLALVALAASYFPARRATQIDPLAALRHE